MTSQIFLKSATWEGNIHKINDTFKKSCLLIGLSKFAQTFAVRFLKSSSIHPICINAWGSFSFNICNFLLMEITMKWVLALNLYKEEHINIWFTKRNCASPFSFVFSSSLLSSNLAVVLSNDSFNLSFCEMRKNWEWCETFEQVEKKSFFDKQIIYL